jgi:hypothetical protein
MDLTAILNRIASDQGLLGALFVVLGVALFYFVKAYIGCYNERVTDLKSQHEIIGAFTQMQRERQATIEALVAQIASMSRVLDLAAQANTTTISKIDRLSEMANAAIASNNQMREAVAALRARGEN